MALEGAVLALSDEGAAGEVVNLAGPAGGEALLDMLEEFEANNAEVSHVPPTAACEGVEGEEAMLEEMFQHRYTEDDAGFQATRQKPLAPPPCVQDWFVRQRRDNWRGRGGGGGFRGNFRGHGGHRGGWQQGGGHYGHSQQWGDRGGRGAIRTGSGGRTGGGTTNTGGTDRGAGKGKGTSSVDRNSDLLQSSGTFQSKF